MALTRALLIALTMLAAQAAGGGAAPAALSAAAPPGAGDPSAALGPGVFLIARETLEDPNFFRSVVLLVEYDASGAVGLIINRPSDVRVAAALPQVDALQDRPETLFVGGPVGRDRLFLLLRSPKPPQGSRPVMDDVHVSSSIDTLREVIAGHAGEAAFRAYAGYSGWGPGQLDAEMARGDWLAAPADADTVFDLPPERVWPDLMRRNAGQWVLSPPIPDRLRGAPLSARCYSFSLLASRCATPPSADT